jgi:hypothetical protein
MVFRSASRLRVVSGWAALVWASVPAHAQAVRGAVRDGAAQPVSGVVLSLLDSTSAVIARALSDERGEFRMLAARAGTVRVRAQRIGFQPTLTAPFVLGVGVTATPMVVLEGAQTQLAAVRVTASSGCGRADADNASLLAVWEQAHTSLSASLLTAGTRGLTTSIMTVRRVLSPRGQLLDQALEMRAGNVVAPWIAIPIDTLRKRGYLWIGADDAITYNAPGLDGFVSPLFLDDHCFRLVASKDTNEIGIGFDPVPARARLSEIRGTLWLSRGSAELRRAEFTYTSVPGVAESPIPGGGRLRFVRLPNGAVIIDDWELRMPVTSRERFGGSTRTRVDQIQTTGGLIVSLRRGADTVFKRPAVALTGIVRDSASGKPLGGATVALTGTQNRTVSGSDGRFTLRDVLPGEYTLAVATPELEAMRASSGTTVIVRDSLAPITVKVPSAQQVAGALCGAGFSPDRGRGAVLGSVTTSGTATGMAGIPVVADWKEFSTNSSQSLIQGQGKRLETKTDGAGAYRLCGVPVEALLTVRAFPASGRANPQTARLTAEQRFATLALTVDPARAAAATFWGRVVSDSGGTPIVDAEVRVDGVERPARTNAEGEFRLEEVPLGTRQVTVRKVGWVPLETPLTFSANEEEERRVVLHRLSVLDSVEVVADRVPLRLVEFEEHRRLGLGWFMGRAELEKLEALKSAQVLSRAGQTEIIGGRFVVSKRFTVPLRALSTRSPACTPPMTSSPPLPEKAGGSICACFPRVYQDGRLMNPSSPAEPFNLDLVPVNQLEAVEWYASPSRLPAQFGGADAPCGVLVLHTRQPGPRKDGTQ